MKLRNGRLPNVLLCIMFLASLAGSMVYVSTTHFRYQEKQARRTQAKAMAIEGAERWRVTSLKYGY